MLCEGSPINGSPFSCKTFDSSAIVVSSVPSGMVGKPVEFKGKLYDNDTNENNKIYFMFSALSWPVERKPGVKVHV